MRQVGRERASRCVFLSALVVATLVLTGVAAADEARIQLSAAGQSAARAIVLKQADLGGASGWTGRTAKPDLSQTLECPNFRPKQSDLVLIGAAESTWKNTALQFRSVAQVLQTPDMVRLDWQRSVLNPRALPCVRSTLVKGLGSSARLVSFRRIAFPQIADGTRAYRALADVKTEGGPVRVLYDIVLVAEGRTEITLTATAPAAIARVIAAAEVRLARVLASRAAANGPGA